MLSSLFPARCALCQQALAEGDFCAACQADLPFNQPCCPLCAQVQNHSALCMACIEHPPSYDRAWVPLRYAAPLKRAVSGLKFHARFIEAHRYGGLMAEALRARTEPLPQRLLPVPLYATRQMRRGYNQALELARVLSTATDIPLDIQTLHRVHAARDQIGASATARRRNVRGVFAATKSLTGLHVALVDDVMTTGATLDELARVCRAAGATRIEVWALARA